jgi:hypothetical protein
MLFKAWGVICSKGPAVFLDHTKAMEYAGKHHGSVLPLRNFPYTDATYVEKTQHNGIDIRQAGEIASERSEQLYPYPPIAEESRMCSGPAEPLLLACGNSSPCETQGLEQSTQDSDDPLQCSGPAC